MVELWWFCVVDIVVLVWVCQVFVCEVVVDILECIEVVNYCINVIVDYCFEEIFQ